MYFQVGDMRAHCPACTSEEFDFLDAAMSDSAALFVCKRCGARSTYGTLLDQITTQVTRRASTVLSNLRRLGKERDPGG